MQNFISFFLSYITLDLQQKIEELITQYDTITLQCETLEAKNSQLTNEYQQKHEQDLHKQEEQMTNFMTQMEEVIIKHF